MKRIVCSAGMALAVVLCGGVCHAQKGGGSGNTSATVSPSSDPGMKAAAPTPMMGSLGDSPEKVRAEIEAQAKANALERQKKNQKDTARLIALADQVRTEVAGLTADQYPAATLKKLDEMEKLARDIKKRAGQN